jgi:hypothetical protein
MQMTMSSESIEKTVRDYLVEIGRVPKTKSPIETTKKDRRMAFRRIAEKHPELPLVIKKYPSGKTFVNGIEKVAFATEIVHYLIQDEEFGEASTNS